ncbi:MAG: hypothetical protein GX557_11115 [Chloroflexi bacterium]|nr:hypothetical protein [Chloroflexota bacterium]
MSSPPHRLRRLPRRALLAPAVGLTVVALAWWLQRNVYNASRRVLLGVAALAGATVWLRDPALGPYLILAAALALNVSVGTGTSVELNAGMLLVPVAVVIWLAHGLLHRSLQFVRSRVTLPMLLFLVAALFSLWTGQVLWDPRVPRPSNLIYVQVGQWAIFAVAAGAVLLVGHTMRSEGALRRLTLFYIGLAGALALANYVPVLNTLVRRYATAALMRSPFWMLLAALAGGQLLFNRDLPIGWRVACMAALAAVLVYALRDQAESASTWVSIAAVAAVLAWYRFKRLRWLAIALLLLLLVTGVLTRALFEFAGGEEEWITSGGSRLTLIGRVVEVTMRNPITGLGPAAYRFYAAMKPLSYGKAFWVHPAVNSHNNYVDLFAHTGLLGLGLFLWWMVECAVLAQRLRRTVRTAFASAFVHSMLAAWVGAMVLMLLADWMLPHVYNIGFPGFQAAIPFWLFLGGLLALKGLQRPEEEAQRRTSL